MANDQTHEIRVTSLGKRIDRELVQEAGIKMSRLPKLSRWKGIVLVLALLAGVIFLIYALAGPSAAITQEITRTEALNSNSHQLNRAARESEESEEFDDKIRYKHTKRRLPSCLIIGCRKAGTRALLTYLNLHPQIQVAKTEVHFFDDEESYENGLEWYRKKMPYSFPNQITIEKSPAYFTNYNVPKRVHKMNSTIKLLLIVRDPTERAVSDYLQIHLNKVEAHKETHTFEELAVNQRTGRVDISYPPLVRSMYYQFMWNWLQVFDLDQFLVINGEELVKNPLPELVKVESFLNLEHKFTPDMFYFNKTRGFYCLKNETSSKCLNESKGRAHPPVDEDVMKMLHQYFAPYNREFYKMIKWNFAWPED